MSESFKPLLLNETGQAIAAELHNIYEKMGGGSGSVSDFSSDFSKDFGGEEDAKTSEIILDLSHCGEFGKGNSTKDELASYLGVSTEVIDKIYLGEYPIIKINGKFDTLYVYLQYWDEHNGIIQYSSQRFDFADEEFRLVAYVQFEKRGDFYEISGGEI